MMPLEMYKKHVADWRDCRLCELCDQRTQVVFARGSIPCGVLFVGEAPGVSEDVIGQPFVGPAGKLQDRMIAEAWSDQADGGPAYCYYNLVGCFPRVAKQARTGNNEPSGESIVACSARLLEFIGVCRPRLLVSVGRLSEDWLEQGYKHSIALPPFVEKQLAIVHPAAILRSNSVQRQLMIQKSVAALSQAVEEVFGAKSAV